MFHRLKLYTVHVKLTDAGEPQDIQFVREGFNIWAFLLNVFWALYHRCWLLAGVSLVILLATQWLVGQGWLQEASVGVMQIGLILLVGFFANDERRHALEKRGYKQQDIVAEENLTRARLRYFERHGRSSYIWQH